MPTNHPALTLFTELLAAPRSLTLQAFARQLRI